MSLITIQGASAGAKVVVTVDGAITDQLATIVTDFSKSLTEEIGGVNGINLVPGSTNFAGNGIGYGVVTINGAYDISGNVGAITFGGNTGEGIPDISADINGRGITSGFVSVEGGIMGGVKFQAGNYSGTFVGGAGNNAFTGDINVSDSNSWYVFTGNGDDTVTTGHGKNVVNAGLGKNYINVHDGQNTIYSYGRDTIYGLSNDYGQTISIHGGNSVINVGSNSYIESLTEGWSEDNITVGSNSTVVGGTADRVSLSGGISTVISSINDTISASNDAWIQWGINVNADVAGKLTFVGGYGTSTVTAANTTVYGASEMNMILNVTSDKYGNSIFSGGTGNETLNASGSEYGVNAFGNIAGTSGSQVFIGGTGADTLVAGVGDATMTGGSGDSNFFAFRDGIAGGKYVITDFNSAAGNKIVTMFYDENEISNAVNGQTHSNGNTTITLSDHSQITFTNVDQIKGSDFVIW